MQVKKKGGFFPLGKWPKFSQAGMADKALHIDNYSLKSYIHVQSHYIYIEAASVFFYYSIFKSNK